MGVQKLYFAMVDAGDTFNPAIHNVEDMEVFDLKISQSEGEFAKAVLEIKNPGIGLLSPVRKQYIFISCDFEGNVVPLFFGRVSGFPTGFFLETITLEYIAQPSNWIATQEAFLETLKVAPYYNVLFSSVDKRSDPSEILASRNALLHWDRFPNGGISLSDIVQGSSTIDLGQNIFFDSLKTTIASTPLDHINGSIEVQWTQNGVGEVDAGFAITQAFTGHKINTLTPIAFEAAWKGVTIPSGYIVKQSALNPIISGIPSSSLKSPSVVVSSTFFPTKDGGVGVTTRSVSVPRVWYTGILKLTASYSQKRRELLSFTLSATTQQFSLSTSNFEAQDYKLQDPTASSQGTILNPNQPTFFYDHTTHILTAYGQAAIENALLRARARLVKAARIVEVGFETEINSLDILNITCDKSIHIEHDKLPSGKMRGKVIGYELHFSDIEQLASITLGSMIGTGFNSLGSGTILQPKLYDNELTGSLTSNNNSAVIYSLGSTPSINVPIDVATMQSSSSYCIVSTVVLNDGTYQNAHFADTSRPDTFLNSNGTGATINLKSMNPTPEELIAFSLVTQPLTLPQHIDLGSL